MFFSTDTGFIDSENVIIIGASNAICSAVSGGMNEIISGGTMSWPTVKVDICCVVKVLLCVSHAVVLTINR
ncbi:MAG: hypothetical protein Kow00102_05630 [Spirochaetota bacterium]